MKKLRLAIILFIVVSLAVFFSLTEGVDHYVSEHFLLNNLDDVNKVDIVETFSNLFSTSGTIIIVAIASAILLFLNKRKEALVLILTMIITALINLLIKEIYLRPRPFYRLVEEIGYSYPSGHSNAVSSFISMIYFMVKNNYTKRASRITLFLGSLLAFSIALSRILLGVHYFSDIVGGLLSGYIVSTLIYKLFYKTFP
ncbi:MAG: phosphatase PAP2 family protein [Firmicutes bacterium]|nr:phosphatase PAP2 family protein [Bacillota bacterium]